MLNLGPRLSEQEYSVDDRALLSSLAIQAAPALRVAQLVQQQKEEARRRERLDQELRIARLIQQTLLPRDLPKLPGWEVAAYYRPAREVGGDFYDFVDLPEGKLGLIIADVTDKGIPAALVMATTRSVLRAAAERIVSPGEVLQRVNDQLVPDIPDNMFVTCLYSILDPQARTLRFANAGHGLLFQRTDSGVKELKATGMPLGLMPDMRYEENEVQLARGDTVLFQSDGLAEAHNAKREMFGFPRVKQLMADHPEGPELIDTLVAELENFTVDGWEHEDDVTLLALECAREGVKITKPDSKSGSAPIQATFSVPSQPGNEHLAIDQVAQGRQRSRFGFRSNGEAEDRGRRSHHERHGARKSVSGGSAGRDPGPELGYEAVSLHHGSWWRAIHPGAGDSGSGGEAGGRAESTRMGVVSNQEHGRRSARNN